MPSKSNYKGRKVNRKHLSELARWILQHAGEGIERGEIVEGYFGIERLYCGFNVDPCFSIREKRRRQRRCRRVQPVVSRTLKRLQERGLVELIRHSRYIKKICLTAKGKILAEKMNKTTGLNDSGK